MSETVIVAALRKGNLRRAVELILDTYQDELFGYCARLVEHVDVVQVYRLIMSTALEELTTFTGNTSIRAWLYGIARNTVLFFHRKRHQLYPGAMDSAYAPVCGPNDVPALQLKDEELEACVGQLEPEVREVLQLALWHGLLLSEVAHVTSHTEAQVRRMAAEGLCGLSLDLARHSRTPS